MKLRIRSTWVHKIDRDELKTLEAELTVRGRSGIKEILTVAEHNKLWAVIAYHRDKAIGWCVLECRDVCYAQVYVKKAYRGNAIGTRLLKRAGLMAKRKKKELLVADLRRSRGFFVKFAAQAKLFWHPLTPSEKPRLITA